MKDKNLYNKIDTLLESLQESYIVYNDMYNESDSHDSKDYLQGYKTGLQYAIFQLRKIVEEVKNDD